MPENQIASAREWKKVFFSAQKQMIIVPIFIIFLAVTDQLPTPSIRSWTMACAEEQKLTFKGNAAPEKT